MPLYATHPSSTWIATYWEPEFDYLPDYTKGPAISATSAICRREPVQFCTRNEHIQRHGQHHQDSHRSLGPGRGNLNYIVTISQRAAGVRAPGVSTVNVYYW